MLVSDGLRKYGDERGFDKWIWKFAEWDLHTVVAARPGAEERREVLAVSWAL